MSLRNHVSWKPPQIRILANAATGTRLMVLEGRNGRPSLLKLDQGRVQARLHRTHRDGQHIRDVTIFQTLVISQDNNLFEEIGQAVNSGADELPPFLALGLVEWPRPTALQCLHQVV